MAEKGKNNGNSDNGNWGNGSGNGKKIILHPIIWQRRLELLKRLKKRT